MDRRGCRRLLGVLVWPAAGVVALAPSSPAATVLSVEGTLQPAGTTHRSFGGAFCASNKCSSVNHIPALLDAQTGSRQLQAAVESTPGDLIVMGYSLGAASVYDRVRRWTREPSSAPAQDRVALVVTFGNPENKFGGEARLYQNVGLPEDQPYQHLDVTVQYDMVADRPTRWGWFSMVNTAFARHFDYYGVDINDPRNLVYQDSSGSTYMLVEAEVLPMLSWLDWFASDEQMAELDSIFRPLVERDYDRPDYVPQGEGADWGNGNPPPGLQDPAEEPSADAEPDGAGPDTVAPDDQQSLPARQPTGSDEPAGGGLTDEAEAEEPEVDEPAVDDPEAEDLATDPETDSEPEIDVDPETDVDPENDTDGADDGDNENDETGGDGTDPGDTD